MPPDPDAIPLPLLRLLSASLPTGTFAYSRGLEQAVAAGWVTDEPTARDWILGTLEHSFAALDGALFLRMMEALVASDAAAFAEADEWLAAGRELHELQLEDRRMAEALRTLQKDLGFADIPTPLTFPAAFALAAHRLGTRPLPALQGLMWGLCDAQVAAAIRLVPLGQTAGQRVLSTAPGVIARAAHRAAALSDDEIGNLAPGLAMASALHETQTTRLFRS